MKNQAKAMWACDFFVQHTVGFRVLYIFVVMELASRKVIHLHVTDHPTLEWTKQQIRNACFEEQPDFLIHDDDGKFGQLGRPFRVENAERRVWCRSAYDEWLWWEMGIRGIPIPYGAPNAAAHIERLIGTLRRECLDRMLIWNERQLRCVLTEFIRWYNHGRVHQGLNGIPDPDPAIDGPKPLGGRLVAIPVLNGLHHDYRDGCVVVVGPRSDTETSLRMWPSYWDQRLSRKNGRILEPMHTGTRERILLEVGSSTGLGSRIGFSRITGS